MARAVAALFLALLLLPSLPLASATTGYGYDDGLSVAFESDTWNSGNPATVLYCIAVDVLQLVDANGNRLAAGELHNKVTWGDSEQEEFDWYSDTNYGEPWASPDYGICHEFTYSIVPYIIDLELTDPYGHEVAFHDTWPGAIVPNARDQCTTIAQPFYKYVGYQVIRWGEAVEYTCWDVFDEFVDLGDPVCKAYPLSGIYFGGDCRWAMTDPGSWANAVTGHIVANGIRIANEGVGIARGTANAWLGIFGLGPI